MWENFVGHWVQLRSVEFEWSSSFVWLCHWVESKSVECGWSSSVWLQDWV